MSELKLSKETPSCKVYLAMTCFLLLLIVCSLVCLLVVVFRMFCSAFCIALRPSHAVV